MERAFDFPRSVKDEAFARQSGKCAHCGWVLGSMDEEDEKALEKHAHHVVPNQSGRRGEPTHAWLATVDNCVILCGRCHWHVHEYGKTKDGAVATAEFFGNSHAAGDAEHQQWLLRINRLSETVWGATRR